MKEIIQRELKELVTLKRSNRKWHIPVLAAVGIGFPLLVGLYYNNLQYGLYACLSGMVILYMPTAAPLPRRMITLLSVSFGFTVSFAVGVIFSFNPWIASVVLGIFTVGVHWTALYFKSGPPGSFFFVMITAMMISFPHHWESIPLKVGLIGLGTMFACSMGLIYSLVMAKQYPPKKAGSITTVIRKNRYANFVEALIMGFFLFAALLTGHLLKFENPYWLPISCAAVMQGASRYHIWQRSFQRILGTFIGLGLCWLILQISTTPLSMVISIIVLQFIIEMLITRQYALAVIFITPMTVLLAEAGNPLIQDPNALISIRFTDIAIGSMIGAIGGWFLHHEKLRAQSIRRIERSKNVLKRRKEQK